MHGDNSDDGWCARARVASGVRQPPWLGGSFDLPHRTRWRPALAAVVLLFSTALAAAEVEFSLAPGPYYVGAPISLQIKVSNEPQRDPPVMPEIEGAEVSGPNTSSQQFIVNFQVTQSIVYTYQIVPKRAGQLVIPPIEIATAGGPRQTSPKTLDIIKADSTGLVFVEVHGGRESLYLGESLDLTLEIWIKPFVDRRNNFGNTVDMEGTIDFRNSTWGPFAEVLKTLRQGQVPVRRAKHASSEGSEQQDYYVYSFKRTLWPEKAGRLELGDVSILVQYPLQVDRTRSFFSFDDSQVTRARPLSVPATVDPITVKAPPAEGQPPGYNGAVGRFEFSVSAKPTEVHVGDPITLTMALTGTGRLDLLQPPKLEEIPPLVENFKIPDEILAGSVEGNVKRFTQTLRARTDTVKEIPSIPFSYFDTATEKYVTLASTPIPITVAAADRLAVSSVVASEGGPRVSTRLTQRAEGILANYTDVDGLLEAQGFAPGPSTLAWGALPPVVFVATVLIRRRRERWRSDLAYAGRRTAKSTALRALAKAPTGSDPRPIAGAVLAALTQYVADRCGRPSTNLTRAEAIKHLRDRGVTPERIGELDALLEECESVEYAGSGPTGPDALPARARECVQQLEKERFE